MFVYSLLHKDKLESYLNDSEGDQQKNEVFIDNVKNIPKRAPNDRLKMVYIIFLLHGVGTLLPWNMFITAKSYFVDYKLSENYTHVKTSYGANFLSYLGLASQGPNFIFNWLNIFVQVEGKLTTRIVWSLLIEMVCFLVTIILAVLDSHEWPGAFFWITMLIVIILNMASGIYQNCVYGMGAKLPSNYTGALILGSNISGTLTSIISIISHATAPDPKSAAIYYFLTAFIVIYLCFDTYFALPITKFYRYHDYMNLKIVRENQVDNVKTPYWEIFKKCFPQCFNVFMVFFVTLTLFPSVQSDIKKSSDDFFISNEYYVDVMCFLTFNVCAMIGSALTVFGSWPNPKWLWLPVVIRLIFFPLYYFCNYQPMGIYRKSPILIQNDWIYWIISIIMSVSSGYYSAVAMMYCPGAVKSEHSVTASMFGAASIMTGICAGIGFGFLFPVLAGI